jgi:hypothetical protein
LIAKKQKREESHFIYLFPHHNSSLSVAVGAAEGLAGLEGGCDALCVTRTYKPQTLDKSNKRSSKVMITTQKKKMK